jgi:hypothetical protein
VAGGLCCVVVPFSPTLAARHQQESPTPHRRAATATAGRGPKVAAPAPAGPAAAQLAAATAALPSLGADFVRFPGAQHSSDVVDASTSMTGLSSTTAAPDGPPTAAAVAQAAGAGSKPGGGVEHTVLQPARATDISSSPSPGSGSSSSSSRP